MDLPIDYSTPYCVGVVAILKSRDAALFRPDATLIIYSFQTMPPSAGDAAETINRIEVAQLINYQINQL
ncbi:MAG: hypothetical protein GF419_00945 [Ignavibacteriales bacterium]|nr:hypothetical protein [Ignavibacteriales bacterium]